MQRIREAGLTLVEILIVSAIVAVLAAIAIPNILAAKLASNEAAAIATLRSLVTAQAQILGSGKIDADADSSGEYGTMAELIGQAGVRTRVGSSGASDFATQGSLVEPPALSESMADFMENSGYLVKGGFAYMIFLPDTSNPARFTHETVRIVTRGRGRGRTRVEAIVLAGGSARVGIDLSESLWCAYAQPVTRGRSGRRTFFTNQQGDILQSANDVAKHQGSTTVIAGRSAFLGSGITSDVASGTRGNDGDVWKIAN